MKYLMYQSKLGFLGVNKTCSFSSTGVKQWQFHVKCFIQFIHERGGCIKQTSNAHTHPVNVKNGMKAVWVARILSDITALTHVLGHKQDITTSEQAENLV